MNTVMLIYGSCFIVWVCNEDAYWLRSLLTFHLIVARCHFVLAWSNLLPILFLIFVHCYYLFPWSWLLRSISSTISSGTISGIAGSVGSGFAAFGPPWSSNFMSITTIRLNGHNYHHGPNLLRLLFGQTGSIWLTIPQHLMILLFLIGMQRILRFHLRMWNNIEPTFNSSLIYLDMAK